MQHRLLFLFICFIFLSACRTTSKISSSGVQPGMSKSEVVRILGKPYKNSFNMSKDSVLYETIYYKESLVNLSNRSTLISALTFKDDKLISLDQNREHISGEEADPFPPNYSATP